MPYRWFSEALSRYLGVVEQGQNRLLDAQQDACRMWFAAWTPAFPLPDSEMQQRVEGSLLASASLWQAQADTQRDLLLTSEKWLADYYRVLLARLAEAGHHPSMDVLRQALQVGYQSGSAFNKVSRQVGHFAATNFSTAPLNAARDMRKVWKQQKP